MVRRETGTTTVPWRSHHSTYTVTSHSIRARKARNKRGRDDAVVSWRGDKDAAAFRRRVFERHGVFLKLVGRVISSRSRRHLSRTQQSIPGARIGGNHRPGPGIENTAELAGGERALHCARSPAGSAGRQPVSSLHQNTTTTTVNSSNRAFTSQNSDSESVTTKKRKSRGRQYRPRIGHAQRRPSPHRAD